MPLAKGVTTIKKLHSAEADLSRVGNEALLKALADVAGDSSQVKLAALVGHERAATFVRAAAGWKENATASLTVVEQEVEKKINRLRGVLAADLVNEEEGVPCSPEEFSRLLSQKAAGDIKLSLIHI